MDLKERDEMKKILVTLLALMCVSLLSFSLFGCNGATPPDDVVYEEE